MKTIKFVFSLVVLVVMASACVKDPIDPEPEQDPISSFSVLGDSYSAFKGYVDPETNDPWSDYEEIGVTGPEQMWWYQLAEETGWTMDKNNSFSGSLICNHNVEYYAKHSFIRRMEGLGNPDVIFVFGGTNDAFKEAPLGDYVYADWTEDQLCMFRPGLAYLLDHLKQQHPKAAVYLLVDMDLCSGGVDEAIRDSFIESMHQVAEHYGVTCIDLYKIHKKWWHPNAQGQQDIAKQVLKVVMPKPNA